MARFKRLTYDEATNMTRGELLKRVGVEQEYWHRKINQGRMAEADWDAFREYGRIMHLLDPGEAIAEALRVVKGEPGPSYWDERPTS